MDHGKKFQNRWWLWKCLFMKFSYPLVFYILKKCTRSMKFTYVKKMEVIFDVEKLNFPPTRRRRQRRRGKSGKKSHLKNDKRHRSNSESNFHFFPTHFVYIFTFFILLYVMRIHFTVRINILSMQKKLLVINHHFFEFLSKDIRRGNIRKNLLY